MLITLDQLKTSLLAMKNFVIQHIPTNISDLNNDAGYLTQHQDISGKANVSDLAVVATSGSYNDLSNKPTIPTNVSDLINDSNFTTQSYVDGEIDSLQTTISTKADIDGSYDSMAVKESERLASLDFTEDNTPYLFRKSGGDGNEEPVIVGGSVVWNQMVVNGDFSDGIGNWKTPPSYGTLEVANGKATVTTTTQNVNQSIYGTVANPSKDHVYLITFDITISEASPKLEVYWGKANIDKNLGSVAANTKTHAVCIAKAGTQSSTTTMYIYPNGTNGMSVGSTAVFENIKCHDLTAMFGTAIADYVLSLGNTAGLAYFHKYGYFTKDYYPYSEPTFKHVEGLVSHKMVGFNQWDEVWETGIFNTTTGANTTSVNQIRSKNYISVLPGSQYFYKCSYYGWFIFFDANKNVIYPTGTGGDSRSGNSVSVLSNHVFTVPMDAHYLRFYTATSYGATYKNDICLNLSDPAKNGTYEPYKAYTYPLDTDVVLRGFPKLDANNDLYFDGDVYKADGTVSRRYGVVDLGTLTWNTTLSNRASATIPNMKIPTQGSEIVPILSENGYTQIAPSGSLTQIGQFALLTDKRLLFYYDGNTLPSGEIVYELATPTTETADPYAPLQLADPYGTEEWVLADGAFPMPVGHETTYRNIVTIQDVKDIQSNIDDIQFDLNNKQDVLTFDSTPTANSTNPVTSGGIKIALDNKETAINNVGVSGVSPVIVAESNTIYNCGEVTSLSFTPCASGICDVRFTSGSTVTVLTIPNTVKFPNSFDPTSLETNKIYEINILDGVYGVVTSWAI